MSDILLQHAHIWLQKCRRPLTLICSWSPAVASLNHAGLVPLFPHITHTYTKVSSCMISKAPWQSYRQTETGKHQVHFCMFVLFCVPCSFSRMLCWCDSCSCCWHCDSTSWVWDTFIPSWASCCSMLSLSACMLAMVCFACVCACVFSEMESCPRVSKLSFETQPCY